MTEIICISGIRVKKDTVAKFLKEELESAKKRVLITYYADPLRRICRDWFGWDCYHPRKTRVKAMERQSEK
jgi:hypothetical protein